MNISPSVSLCVPTYNGQTYLRECLESAINQTFKDIEILVVDDASTDDTRSIVEEFKRRDPRLSFHRNTTNIGLVDNWNRCIALARGSWIKFLFQDDLLDQHCIERMLGVASEGSLLVICRRNIACELDVSDQDREEFLEFVRHNNIALKFPFRVAISAEEFREKFLQDPTHNWIGEPTAALIHRTAFDRFGYFNRGLVSLCDWEFFARVAVNAGLRLSDDYLATFRVHRHSMSGEQRAAKSFRALYLDPLIIRHDMVYHEAYRCLRTHVSHDESTAALTQELLYAVRDARLYAEKLAYDIVEPNSGPLEEWRRVQREFPKMDSIPCSYIWDWVKRRSRLLLRHATGLATHSL